MGGVECHRVRYGEKFKKPGGWTMRFEPSEDAESVAIVRRLFDRYATCDIGYGSLATELNTMGTPSPEGGAGVLNRCGTSSRTERM